jgi:hypothetical protein
MHNHYIEHQLSLSSSLVFNDTNKRFTILNIYPHVDNNKKINKEEAFKPSTSNRCCIIS